MYAVEARRVGGRLYSVTQRLDVMPGVQLNYVFPKQIEKNILRLKMLAGQIRSRILLSVPHVVRMLLHSTPKEMMLYNITLDHIYPVRLHLQENSMLYLNVSTNLYT